MALHLRTDGIDLWRDFILDPIRRLLVELASGGKLRLCCLHTGGASDHLHVCRSYCENDHIARILDAQRRRLFIALSSEVLISKLRVVKRLR